MQPLTFPEDAIEGIQICNNLLCIRVDVSHLFVGKRMKMAYCHCYSWHSMREDISYMHVTEICTNGAWMDHWACMQEPDITLQMG